MAKKSKNPDNSGLTQGLIGFFSVVLLAVVGYLVFHASAQSTRTNTTSGNNQSSTVVSSNPYAVLSPATVASKTAECTTPITYASNGDSSPVTCSNGDLNVTEWNALATLEPKVMSLGPSATEAQVQSALCSDATDSASDANTSNSNAIEATTYTISALYYGWNFASNPSVVLTNGTC